MADQSNRELIEPEMPRQQCDADPEAVQSDDDDRLRQLLIDAAIANDVTWPDARPRPSGEKDRLANPPEPEIDDGPDVSNTDLDEDPSAPSG